MVKHGQCTRQGARSFNVMRKLGNQMKSCHEVLAHLAFPATTRAELYPSQLGRPRDLAASAGKGDLHASGSQACSHHRCPAAAAARADHRTRPAHSPWGARIAHHREWSRPSRRQRIPQAARPRSQIARRHLRTRRAQRPPLIPALRLHISPSPSPFAPPSPPHHGNKARKAMKPNDMLHQSAPTPSLPPCTSGLSLPRGGIPCSAQRCPHPALRPLSPTTPPRGHPCPQQAHTVRKNGPNTQSPPPAHSPARAQRIVCNKPLRRIPFADTPRRQYTLPGGEPAPGDTPATAPAPRSRAPASRASLAVPRLRVRVPVILPVHLRTPPSPNETDAKRKVRGRWRTKKGTKKKDTKENRREAGKKEEKPDACCIDATTCTRQCASASRPAPTCKTTLARLSVRRTPHATYPMHNTAPRAAPERARVRSGATADAGPRERIDTDSLRTRLSTRTSSGLCKVGAPGRIRREAPSRGFAIRIIGEERRNRDGRQAGIKTKGRSGMGKGKGTRDPPHLPPPPPSQPAKPPPHTHPSLCAPVNLASSAHLCFSRGPAPPAYVARKACTRRAPSESQRTASCVGEGSLYAAREGGLLLLLVKLVWGRKRKAWRHTDCVVDGEGGREEVGGGSGEVLEAVGPGPSDLGRARQRGDGCDGRQRGHVIWRRRRAAGARGQSFHESLCGQSSDRLVFFTTAGRHLGGPGASRNGCRDGATTVATGDDAGDEGNVPSRCRVIPAIIASMLGLLPVDP
ncbi:hypothetical protein DFH09DRAFT_1083637 [Mycena vulgaris]|nr:hypothetical protein DFH09DRAFT_1083637 [Mycena vulgaris]